MSRLTLCALLVTAMPAFADVITNTTCSVAIAGVTVSRTDPTSCTANLDVGPGLNGGSSASVSYTLSRTPTSVASSFNSSISTAATSGVASATFSGSSSLLLSTAGPVRSGFLSFDELNLLTGFGWVASSATTVGSLSENCVASSGLGPATCTGSFGMFGPHGSGMVPFTLGQSFTFIDSVQGNASAGGGNPHFGSGGTSFTFTVFEADGTTPVVLSEVPEPQSLGLLGAGLLGLVATARHFRKP